MTAAKKNKTSFKVAFGGIITAFALICMLATGVIPIGTYTFPALAGIMLIAVVIELDLKWAWAVFTATAVLSLLIAPDREAALLYLFFFGHYPIVKSYLERLNRKPLEWLLKLIIFNACILICYGLIFYVFQMQYVIESFQELGRYSLIIFLAVGNIAFFIYDIALTNLITFYIKWVRVKILKRL